MQYEYLIFCDEEDYEKVKDIQDMSTDNDLDDYNKGLWMFVSHLYLSFRRQYPQIICDDLFAMFQETLPKPFNSIAVYDEKFDDGSFYVDVKDGNYISLLQFDKLREIVEYIISGFEDLEINYFILDDKDLEGISYFRNKINEIGGETSKIFNMMYGDK